MTTSHCIDIKDRRKATRQAKNPMIFDIEAVEIALAVVGVDITDGLVIKVRIKDGEGDNQGVAQQIGPNAFLVKVYVSKKDVYADRHHYVINNSLLHELRHVAQMQETPGFQAAYAKATKQLGYQANPFEIEARFYGRLADHTGTKATGPAGKALGKTVWAIHFGGVENMEVKAA